MSDKKDDKKKDTGPSTEDVLTRRPGAETQDAENPPPPPPPPVDPDGGGTIEGGKGE